MSEQRKKKSAAKSPDSALSSTYLPAGSTGLAMSELEIALVILWNTFSRWVEHCADAADIKGLSTQDLLVLHFLQLRGRQLRVSDVCFALSIEDQHVVTYSARKLVKLGLLHSHRNGKETLYSTTPASEASFRKYVDIRQRFLIATIELVQNPEYDLAQLPGVLRTLSGLYEQAARGAASR